MRTFLPTPDSEEAKKARYAPHPIDTASRDAESLGDRGRADLVRQSLDLRSVDADRAALMLPGARAFVPPRGCSRQPASFFGKPQDLPAVYPTSKTLVAT